MSIIVNRIPEEPIILATFTGMTNISDARYMFSASARLFDEMGCPHVWRIADLSAADASVVDLVAVLSEVMLKRPPGSPADPRFSALIVGSHYLLKLLTRALKEKQYGSVTVPLFTSLTDALDHARSEIASTKSTA